jgi:hypothetical protein
VPGSGQPEGDARFVLGHLTTPVLSMDVEWVVMHRANLLGSFGFCEAVVFFISLPCAYPILHRWDSTANSSRWQLPSEFCHDCIVKSLRCYSWRHRGRDPH